MRINTGDCKFANFVRCENFVFKESMKILQRPNNMCQLEIQKFKSFWSLKESKDETIADKAH